MVDLIPLWSALICALLQQVLRISHSPVRHPIILSNAKISPQEEKLQWENCSHLNATGSFCSVNPIFGPFISSSYTFAV